MLEDHVNETRDFTPEGHFIAYFDILGYESMAKTDEGVIDIAKKIDRCISKIREIVKIGQDVGLKRFNHEKTIKEHFTVQHKVFSDNFLICSKKNWQSILVTSLLIQRYLLRDEIFIRGALCHGNIYFSEDFICGKGIISAYKLENEIAIFPRIIIDNSFLLASNYSSLEMFYARSDFDGQNYLSYLSDDLPSDKKEFTRLLKLHKGKIEKNLQIYVENHRVLQKFQWCKNYHNQICKEKGLTDFLITL